jgi:hypothetical protein
MTGYVFRTDFLGILQLGFAAKAAAAIDIGVSSVQYGN